jgi:hypothetical protein
MFLPLFVHFTRELLSLERSFLFRVCGDGKQRRRSLGPSPSAALHVAVIIAPHLSLLLSNVPSSSPYSFGPFRLLHRLRSPRRRLNLELSQTS